MKNAKIIPVGFFEKTIIYSFVIALAVCFLIEIFSVSVFSVHESQLLYLFSTLAQVIGAVFGLTLTAYIFYLDKFRDVVKNNETYYEATNALITQYFRILILLASISGLILFCCIAGFILLHNWHQVYSVVINLSVILFIIDIIYILWFGIKLVDPNILDKEDNKLVQNLSAKYKHEKTDRPDSFEEFLKTYNLLENLIIQFAENLTNTDFRKQRNYKPLMIQSLKVLLSNEIINNKLINEINEFRIYRNGLVHGTEFSISHIINERIKGIYFAIRFAFSVYKKEGRDNENWIKAIQNLYTI